jgi:hypothetical protein
LAAAIASWLASPIRAAAEETSAIDPPVCIIAFRRGPRHGKSAAEVGVDRAVPIQPRTSDGSV